MILLLVVVHDEFTQRMQQTPLAKDDQAVQTLLANRAHEPFRIGIGIRRLNGRHDDAHPGSLEYGSEFICPLAVAVTDQHAMAHHEAIHRIREPPRRLSHKPRIGIPRRPGAGGIPLSLSTLATVLLATQWSRFFKAPWMRL